MKKNRGPGIVVVGSGSAGIAAAVAAARSGMDVTLLEKRSYPGGNATGAAVGTICGLYLRNSAPTPLAVHKGFPMEFAEDVMNRSGTHVEHQKDGLFYIPYKIRAFKDACSGILLKEGIELLPGSEIVKIQSDRKSIQSIEISRNGSSILIPVNAVVDCSGTAIVAEKCGLETISSESYQSAALVFGLAGIKAESATQIDLALKRLSMGESDFSVYLRGTSVVPGSFHGDRVLLKMGIPDQITDDDIQLKEIKIKTYRILPDVVSFLTKNSPLFEKSTLEYTSPEIGVRVQKRTKGRTVLTGENVLNCEKKDDGVVRGVWPVEKWTDGHKLHIEYLPERKFYHIPSGSLRANGLNNLFMAGRGISADDDAIASARVIGTALATGYAAGMLCAGMLSGERESSTIKKIQAEIFTDIPVGD